MEQNCHCAWEYEGISPPLVPFAAHRLSCPVSSACSHLTLYVSEVNGLCTNIQEHLLAPQLFVLSQEGETGLGFLHTLHIPVLERECQQVLHARRQTTQ